jgi:hypothetical protein
MEEFCSRVIVDLLQWCRLRSFIRIPRCSREKSSGHHHSRQISTTPFHFIAASNCLHFVSLCWTFLFNRRSYTFHNCPTENAIRREAHNPRSRPDYLRSIESQHSGAATPTRPSSPYSYNVERPHPFHIDRAVRRRKASTSSYHNTYTRARTSQ